MANDALEIKSRPDYLRVLREATDLVRALGSDTPNPALREVGQELDTIHRWVERGHDPTPAEQDNIKLGLIAVREFEGATGKTAQFADMLISLKAYARILRSDDAANQPAKPAPPDYGGINSRAEFRRVLADVLAYTNLQIGDRRYVDKRWFPIQIAIIDLKNCTADGRTPTEAERRDINIARFAEPRLLQQGDWNDYVKKLVSLNKYFVAWPPDVAPEPVVGFIKPAAGFIKPPAESKQLETRASKSKIEPPKRGTKWHRFWVYADRNTRLVGSTPAATAYCIYWILRLIGVDATKYTALIVLGALSGIWMVLFLAYAMLSLIRMPFARCPRCHRTFGLRYHCAGCGRLRP
jgi:hypothetical protein